MILSSIENGEIFSRHFVILFHFRFSEDVLGVLAAPKELGLVDMVQVVGVLEEVVDNNGFPMDNNHLHSPKSRTHEQGWEVRLAVGIDTDGDICHARQPNEYEVCAMASSADTGYLVSSLVECPLDESASMAFPRQHHQVRQLSCSIHLFRIR